MDSEKAVPVEAEEVGHLDQGSGMVMVESQIKLGGERERVRLGYFVVAKHGFGGSKHAVKNG